MFANRKGKQEVLHLLIRGDAFGNSFQFCRRHSGIAALKKISTR